MNYSYQQNVVINKDNQARSQGGAMGAYTPHPPLRQAKMVRVVEYLYIITVSPQEQLSPPTVEHSL